MIETGAAVAAVALILGGAWLGGRAFRQPTVLPVAATFRTVGVAAVSPGDRLDVVQHRRVRGGHRGAGRATRSDKQRRLVPNGVHRSGIPWAELDRQRQRFAALIRGGVR